MEEEANASCQRASAVYTPIVDDQTVIIYTYVVQATICPAIAVCGIVTNVINIICFVKQGFNESVNITLLGLTISDVFCLITLILADFSFIPALSTADLPFDVLGVNYLIVAMPHFTFYRLSAWTTAIITLERCFCIMAPLKIKTLITPKRMSVVVVCVYIMLISSGSPVYSVNSLGLIFSPRRNKTILGLVSSSDKENVEKITFIINNFFFTFAAFTVIIVCTTLLVLSLRRRTKWRQSSTIALQTDVSSRHARIAKMVVMISTLFILCFIPMSVTSLLMAIIPGYNIYGKYMNIALVVTGISVLMESINSSANIFIYYRMSAKYRDTFKSIFSIYKYNYN